MLSSRLAEASAKYLQRCHVTFSRITMKLSFAVAQTINKLQTTHKKSSMVFRQLIHVEHMDSNDVKLQK